MTVQNRISAAKFARVWADPTLSKAEVAAATGFVWAKSAVIRAKALNLPTRPNEACGRKPRITDDGVFREMWSVGVPGRSMAAHFGVSETSVRNARDRLQLPPRSFGWRGQVTLRSFLADFSAPQGRNACFRNQDAPESQRASGGARFGVRV